MASAEFCKRIGRAIVYEADGRIFILEHDKDKPEDGSGVHRGMFLQPAMVWIEYRDDVGEYPYKDFHNFLQLSYFRLEAFTLILISVDSEMSLSIRVVAAELAWDALSSGNVRGWVAERLLDIPLLNASGIADLPHQQLKEFIISC